MLKRERSSLELWISGDDQRYKIKLEEPDKSVLKIVIKLLRPKRFKNNLQTICNSMGLASATTEFF